MQRIIIICLCRYWENVVEQLFTHVVFFFYVRGQVRLIAPASIRLAVNTNHTSFFILKMSAVSRAFFPEYKELFFFFSELKSWQETCGLWFRFEKWHSAPPHFSLLEMFTERNPSASLSESRRLSPVVPPFSGSVSGCDVTNCDVRTRTTTFKWHRWSKRCFAVRIAKGFKLVLKLKIWAVKKKHTF